MSKQQPTELEKLPNLLPWVVGFAAVMLVGFYVWAFNQLPLTESPPAWGAFGDYLGGLLNPLVSTFTLIVAVKVWQQQKVELRQTKEALEEQAKTAEQQRQEQRFFDLLRVLQRVEESLTHSYVPVGGGERWVFHGKEAIQKWTAGLDRTFEMTRRYGLGQIIYNGSVTIDKPHVQQQWATEFPQTPFASHLRTIYRILKDADHLLGDQRYRYIKLLRAQLSTGELELIAWAIWLDDEWASLRNLVAEYGLLKHLPSNGLRKELESDFPHKIFGKTATSERNSSSDRNVSPC